MFLRIDKDTLTNLNDSKELEQKLTARVRDKSSKLKFNIPFPEFTYFGREFEKRMDDIAGILTDIVYLQPNIDIINPPRMNFSKRMGRQTREEIYMKFLKKLISVIEDTVGQFKMSFYIPDYSTRNEISRLLDFYIGRFGSDSLIILDSGGGTFNSNCSKTFYVMREMRRVHKEDNYLVYSSNQKPSKKSGEEVPSEDFLSFLNGTTFVGPSHTGTVLPEWVRKQIKNELGKFFHKEDLLYYPFGKDPTGNISEELMDFIKTNYHTSTVRRDYIRRFNAKSTEDSLADLVSDADSFWNNIRKSEFTQTHEDLTKRRNTLLKTGSLNDFF